ncbi:deoxyribonuclease IV [uncultured Eubacterium sp.]|uniref:deoxyribonuclease IV n=1 Tax=uncultured Eubacterium sp. TaxID=165185 RepID=UPI0026718C9F|nr:deoxyribonuclease IV [uncultured Eubacterium sp.]
MLKIGSHVGMSGKDMLLGSAKEAYSYGANVFMAYTGAPQNTRRKDVSELKIKEAWEYMNEHNIEEIIIHAPYIINLGNTIKPETYEIAEKFLATELERTEAMGSKVMVLHPGSHVGAGVDAGINQIVNGLNNVLTKDTNVYVALETMAGKGSEIGRNFEELARIYDGVVHNDKLRVCFDTCHVNDSGYDLVNDLSGTLEQFDKVIGKDQIAVFHINDSKNPCGASKDRHENIGFGNIGFDTLKEIVYLKEFENVPKILETPYIKDEENKKKAYAPYKYEIEMLREGKFNPEMQRQILADNK